MPNYTYHCPYCGPFEKWSTMADYAPESKCPQCAELSGREIRGDMLTTHGTMGFGKAAWTDGKMVAPLVKGDPDRFVTSPNQLTEVCRDAGLDRDTGQVIDQQKYDARCAKYRAKGRREAQKNLEKRGGNRRKIHGKA